MRTELTKGQTALVAGVLVYLLLWVGVAAATVVFSDSESILEILDAVSVGLFAVFMFVVGGFCGATAYSDRPGVRKWLATNLPRKKRDWFGVE